jgi:CRISPR/Cas system-associated endoribonuclease Cas2
MFMTELEYLLEDIEKLRQNLYKLINEKQANLVDAEIISASQMLNAALTKYNEIITKKMEK